MIKNKFCYSSETLLDFVKGGLINMIRARDKEKNLSPNGLNPRPTKHQAGALSTELWELFIHLPLLMIDDFDSANPSSMQDTCHMRTQINDHPFL